MPVLNFDKREAIYDAEFERLLDAHPLPPDYIKDEDVESPNEAATVRRL